MLQPFLLRVLAVVALVAGVGLQACSTDGSGGGSNGDFFESDSPTPAGGERGPVNSGAGGGGGAGGTGLLAPEADGSGDPSRAIVEADIVQLAGDRLYALSRYGGLSVIDASQPANLKMLGRYRTEFTPFELYVRGNVVLALYSDWGSHEKVGAVWQWVQTSYLLALDTADPSRIKQIGSFRVPGQISDSRIVGDVLYLVSYENGYCYECASSALTRVLSLDVRDPRAVRKVEALSFDNTPSQWGGGQRSISVTTSRIYVAGPEYASENDASSVVQVVDISDPAGDMVLGANVRVDGQIQSRWQMDEHEGVLRVLSQPWQWMSNASPSVQTFRVESSQSLQPLGRAELRLPRPEQLQSVRFDGPRAYAITFQRTDPLFTIDLSDPAQPRQVGELEMPGFVYHMEPRGDRLLGLGFDQQNPAGALHVSIFDVSDLAAPRLIDRVNFGGDWAALPEDQDRVHKAFQVLDTQGLILVPYSGSTSRGAGEGFCGDYHSGVQLVDFTRDDLVLRAAVPSYGQARRAFLHRSALFTVSDDRVQTFDVADRSAPKNLDDVLLARYVQSSAVVGTNLVRLGNDWWSGVAQLDVVPLSAPDTADPVGKLDLQSAVLAARGGGASLCGHHMTQARVFGHGQRAYVFYDDYSYDASYTTRFSTGLAVIDLSDPSSPRLEANEVLAFSTSYGWYGWGGDYVVPSGEQVVQVGSTFVLSRLAYQGYGAGSSRSAWLDVVDASNPAEIAVTSLEMPSLGNTGLHRSGSGVLTSHYEPSSDGRVRFYLDRIDVSKPRAPRRTTAINVPGSLLAWDAESNRAVTVDYKKSVREGVTLQQCYEVSGGRASWESEGSYGFSSTPGDVLGRCTTLEHTLKQVHIGSGRPVVEGSWKVPDTLQVSSASVGDDRVFVGFHSVGGYYYADRVAGGACAGECPENPAAKLLVLSGLGSGELHASTLDLESREQYGAYISQLLAVGTRALVGVGYGRGLSIIESDGGAPREVSTVNTAGYPMDVERHANLAILSLGYEGVRVVDMSR
ncbi:MAG TPA: beta-propeller domain-containing protein [Polyangiaceae bacterium]